MARYIDAEKIRYSDMSNGLGLVWVTYRERIQEMPTADVQEVKHGKWIDNEITYQGELLQIKTCSVCGKCPNNGGSDYCPKCGAKMDLEEEADADKL